MFNTGYWKIGTLRGIPVRLHWTIPVGGAVFSGFTFAPAFWLAFGLLVLLHELGHAVLVRHFGHRPLAIDVTGFGGLCRWSGHATAFERSAIAWGGILAQGILLLVTLIFLLIFGSPTNAYAAQVVHVFTRANLLIMGINLLPFPPLDGAEAWKMLRQGRLSSLLTSLRAKLSRPTPRRSKEKAPGQVLDFEKARRKRQEADVAHEGSKSNQSAKEVADELIRLSKEAAQARKKRDEN